MRCEGFRHICWNQTSCAGWTKGSRCIPLSSVYSINELRWRKTGKAWKSHRANIFHLRTKSSTSNHLSGCGLIAIKWVQSTILLHIIVHSCVRRRISCTIAPGEFKRLIKFPSCFSLTPFRVFLWRDGLRNAQNIRGKLFCATLFSVILLASAGERWGEAENTGKFCRRLLTMSLSVLVTWRCTFFFLRVPSYRSSSNMAKYFVGKICDVDAVFLCVLALLLQTSTENERIDKEKYWNVEEKRWEAILAHGKYIENGFINK